MYTFPHRAVPATPADKLLLLQDKMNMTLDQLLAVRASRGLCHKELDLNVELVAHLNEAQATEAIRQAKVHCTITAYTLQQVHKDSIIAMECQAMAEERQAHQALMEAFGVAIPAYLPEN